MRYTNQNGMHIVEVPISDFRIVMRNERKKLACTKNACNAGFFANFEEGKESFTLPVGHLVCDYDVDSKWVKFYCEERGKFLSPTKYQFDASKFAYNNPFCGKKVTTLCVFDQFSTMYDLETLPTIGLKYAIAGVPIMRGGEDVKFATYVKNQGWGGSSLYATWHIFVGLKEERAQNIYVIAMKTTKGNMITAAEAYQKFKPLGFYDVIKLDGGGSCIMNVDGRNVASTIENRRINTIIEYNGNSVSWRNPYSVPTVTLQRGNKHREFNKWLQWQLKHYGFNCGEIDGSFGPATEAQVKAFQRDREIVVDGSVGPVTRAELLAE